RAYGKIIELFESGRGVDIPSIKGSWWQALNSVTEWIDHERTARGAADARLYSAWFGQGKQIKERALKTALEMAA
ncbi:DUF932 domain-containing protein, partial [Candidatus Riflebacteria bacterium]